MLIFQQEQSLWKSAAPQQKVAVESTQTLEHYKEHVRHESPPLDVTWSLVVLVTH